MLEKPETLVVSYRSNISKGYSQILRNFFGDGTEAFGISHSGEQKKATEQSFFRNNENKDCAESHIVWMQLRPVKFWLFSDDLSSPKWGAQDVFSHI